MNQMNGTQQKDWLACLDDEDRAFIRRFMLKSGSLKAVAQLYAVSYPTVRLRLDRLIQKIEVYEDQTIVSPFERLLRAKFAAGVLDAETLRDLLAAHQQEVTES